MTTPTDTSPKNNAPSGVTFPELEAVTWLRHAFITRQPDIPVDSDRSDLLLALRRRHEEILLARGIPHRDMATAEQVHGAQVASIDRKPKLPAPGCDALVTATPGLPIGIYVADCCAVYLVETRRRAIALLHSGLKGTQQNIAKEGVRALVQNRGADPREMIAILSPCIRGCCYREEFADRIFEQLLAEKVEKIFRHDRCTACQPDIFYSYHKEKGRTGRMLAAMMIAE